MPRIYITIESTNLKICKFLLTVTNSAYFSIILIYKPQRILVKFKIKSKLNLSIHNDIVSIKIYDKRDDFNCDIINFPFLDGDVPQRPSYGVYTRPKF